MKYQVTINNKTYEVEVERGEAQLLASYEAVAAPAPVSAAPAAAAPAAAAPAAAGPTAHVQVAAGEALTSPMPGTILSVLKKVGDKVTEGEAVCVLEAMKMENEIVAPQDGTVASVNCAKGDVVNVGDVLVSLN